MDKFQIPIYKIKETQNTYTPTPPPPPLGFENLCYSKNTNKSTKTQVLFKSSFPHFLLFPLTLRWSLTFTLTLTHTHVQCHVAHPLLSSSFPFFSPSCLCLLHVLPPSLHHTPQLINQFLLHLHPSLSLLILTYILIFGELS